MPRAPFQYPTWRLTVRSHEVSKPQDLGSDFSNRSTIRQASRQRCCRDACQISERYDHHKIQSRDFETSRYLTVRRLPAKWIEALFPGVISHDDEYQRRVQSRYDFPYLLFSVYIYIYIYIYILCHKNTKTVSRQTPQKPHCISTYQQSDV